MTNWIKVRRALYLDFGVPFPGIHLRFNQGLKDGEYLIQLQEVPVARGQLRVGQLLVQETAAQMELLGVPCTEGEALLAGKPVLWTAADQRERLERGGYALWYGPSADLAPVPCSANMRRTSYRYPGNPPPA